MADGYLNFDTKINEKGFNDGISKLGKLGKSGLKVATRAVTALGVAAGTGIAAAVKVGATFEAEMSKVSAISGATGEDFQKLTDKAKEMGAKTKFSATESAQAMEYMAMAGWKTGDMLNGIEGIMNLAAASGEDLAATSDIVTDALTAMGLSASDSGHFADVLAAAASNSNTNVSMMGETFKYAAPLAGALGYNIEDLGQAIGLMANAGIKGSQSGTALRSILTRLAKPPKEAAEAMDKYKISLKNSDGTMKSLMEAMENMRDALQGLPEDEQSAAAAAIGGQEAMSGLLAIVNASEEDFKKLADSIDNADGSAAEMAATMQDNLAGQLTILKSGLEGLGISIYESLEKPLKEVAAVAVKVISDLNEAYSSGGFSSFIDEIGKKVPMLQGATSAISDLARETKGMSSSELMDFGKMAVVVAGSAPGVIGFGKAIGVVKTTTKGFNDVLGGVTSNIAKLPKSTKGAVKSAGAEFEKIKGEFKYLGESIALPFQDLGEKIAPRLKDLGGFMAESWANGPGGKITGAVTNTVKKIGGAFGQIGPKLAEKFPGIAEKFAELGTKMSAVSAKISKVLGKAGTKISEYAGFIADAFTPILSRVASFAPTFFKLINIGAGAAIIVAGMGLIYSQFGTQIDQLLLLVQTKGPEVITNFANGITAALPGLVAQGATLIMGILNAITVNLPALITAGVSIISTLTSSLAAQLPQLIPCAVQMILTLVTSLISNLPQLITSGLNLMKGLASGIANSIPLVAAKAPVIIGKLASTIITNLPKILTAGVQIISKLAVGLVQGIPALIGKIPSMVSQIKNAFTSVNWGSVGMNIIKGIASGLTGAASAIVEAAKSAANKALDAAKSALGIHSPSRVFRDQVGKMMALGMGIGFEKNIPIKSMNVGVQKAVSGLQKSVDLALSARTTDKTIGRVKNYPGFDGGKDIDYDRLEKIQMRAAEKMAKRPIYLGTKRIDEPLPKGAVPAL